MTSVDESAATADTRAILLQALRALSANVMLTVVVVVVVVASG